MADNAPPLSFKRRQSGNSMNRTRPGRLLDLPFDSPGQGLAHRVSTSSIFRRWSGSSRARSSNHDPFGPDQESKDNKIPSLLPEYSPPDNSTPLPKIAITVLCLCMLGEFLSAATPAAFMFFMIQEFYAQGMDPDNLPEGLEAKVAAVNGVVASVFFLSQFLTSLLWASIAQKHGRRIVLAVSLLGNAVSLILFGASTNTKQATVARLAQGVFAGAVGVARGAVREVTDPTNEARAYTLVGLSWGLGGIVGPIIGGLTEHPAVKFPRVFGRNQFLIDYPYVFPCILSACFMFIGAILCTFLARDGGPRTGAIQLPADVEEARLSFPRRVVSRVASYITTPGNVILPESSDQAVPLIGSDAVPLASEAQTGKYRKASMAPSTHGTSYGYRKNSSMARRYTNQTVVHRDSIATSTGYAPDFERLLDDRALNFAQRLLLANEPGVFNISDLWVAAAQTVDESYQDWVEENEDPFDEEDESEAVSLASGASTPTADQRGKFSDATLVGMPSTESLRSMATRRTVESSQGPPGDAHLVTPTRDRSLVRDRVGSPMGLGRPPLLASPRARSVSQRRRTSVASTRPLIFSNTGLPESRIALSEVPPDTPAIEHGLAPSLAPIPEGKMPKSSPTREASPVLPFPPPGIEQPQSPFSQLPLGVIMQLFVLAFHGVGCDQIFMTFLVTPVPSGGLGLTAAHYSQLVAAMVFFSMFYQFKVYPALGPPNGQLSHLTMLRLGLSCYIPVYILFPTLRSLYSEQTNSWVMAGMIAMSAMRYFANTCAYTSIMVLTNALSPPHLLTYANGLAQSAASAARFLGPVVGGFLWSWSIEGGPQGRPYPFDYHFAFYCVALVCCAGILLSFRIGA